jgi:membrane protein DedA with SNARE-associated domain
MPDVDQLIDAWGYAAIFVIVILGNLGLPVPEETVLTIGGYLAWQGQLRFLLVVIVGVVSAVTGDNLSYWLGRRYGQRLIRRVAAASPERAERMRHFVLRHGMVAVFVARFVAGLRFMAGPLAGSTGLPGGRFFVANLLGAVVYVPVIVGLGYAAGYGLGERIERLRRLAGNALHVALAVLVLAAIGVWIARMRRSRRP